MFQGCVALGPSACAVFGEVNLDLICGIDASAAFSLSLQNFGATPGQLEPSGGLARWQGAQFPLKKAWRTQTLQSLEV